MAYPTLLAESGLFQGSRYVICAGFRIQGHPDNDLDLTDQNTSRFHAIIELREQGCLPGDLGGGNGTFVNGEQMAQLWLRPGDEIPVGRVRLRLMEEPATRHVTGGPSGTIVLAHEAAGRVKVRTPAAHTAPREGNA